MKRDSLQLQTKTETDHPNQQDGKGVLSNPDQAISAPKNREHTQG
jgi:hypothetical protein